MISVGRGAGGEASEGGGFGTDAFVEVVGDELGIGGGEVGSGEFAVVEVDLLEESLVHEPSGFGSSELVCIEWVSDFVDGDGEVVFELFVTNPEGGDEAVGVGFFSVDSVLFFFEKVDGDGVGSVGVESFLAFGAELLKPCFLAGDFSLAEPVGDAEVIEHGCFDVFEFVGW
ncbi:MAG: hypothetical protein R2754_15480 [Microthrixaceae bacterium]